MFFYSPIKLIKYPHINPPVRRMQERNDIPVVLCRELFEMISHLVLPLLHRNVGGFQVIYLIHNPSILICCYPHMLFILFLAEVFQIGFYIGIFVNIQPPRHDLAALIFDRVPSCSSSFMPARILSFPSVVCLTSSSM